MSGQQGLDVSSSRVPKVSLAIPVFNEEAVLPELLRRCLAALDATPGGPHELVLADDGSRDGSGEILARAAAEDPRVVVLRLSRNFGHQAAITAAMDHATGDAILVMDGDLQDRPEELPRFLAKLAEGYDVVYARRVGRKEAAWLRVCYFLFYRLIARLSSVDLPLDAGDFALLSRRALDALKATPERNRYLRGLRSWIGFRQTDLPVERAAREAGESKYSLTRLVDLALDGVFAFSLVPLRVATWFGFVAIALASGFVAYAAFVRMVLGEPPPGFTALIFAIVFLAGVQLVFLGVLGEYIGRIYNEVKRRPHYILEEILGAAPPRSALGPQAPASHPPEPSHGLDERFKPSSL